MSGLISVTEFFFGPPSFALNCLLLLFSAGMLCLLVWLCKKGQELETVEERLEREAFWLRERAKQHKEKEYKYVPFTQWVERD